MKKTRSGTVYSAPEPTPGALPMSGKGGKKKKKSKDKSPLHCCRCQVTIIENDMGELREFQRSIKDEKIRCSRCNYTAPVSELLSSFNDHFCQEHPDVIAITAQDDGSCPYCNFQTEEEDDSKDQARKLYAHMDAEHHEKTRAFVKEYFMLSFRDNNVVSNRSSAGLFACDECGEITYCMKTEDLCLQCFPFCNECIRTRLSKAASTDPPHNLICSDLISPTLDSATKTDASRETEEPFEDADSKTQLEQAVCLSQSLIRSPSPVPDDGISPCGVSPPPTLPPNPAEKFDISCRTEETIDDADSKRASEQAECLPESLVRELPSVLDNENPFGGIDSTFIFDTSVAVFPPSNPAKSDNTTCPSEEAIDDADSKLPSVQAECFPESLVRETSKDPDKECTASGVDHIPTSVFPVSSEPVAVSSKLSPMAAPFLPQTPDSPVDRPKRRRSRRRRRRRSRSRKRKKASEPEPVTLTQPNQPTPVEAPALPNPPPISQKSPPVVTPPVSPSNGRRRSRSRSRNRGRDRSRSEDKPVLPDPVPSRKMNYSSVVEGRAPSSRSMSPPSGPAPRFEKKMTKISLDNATSSKNIHSFTSWVPSHVLEMTPVPVYIENLCGRIGTLVCYLYGVKVFLGTASLYETSTFVATPNP